MERTVIWYLTLFIIPFTGVLFLTPLISKFAVNQNITDKPGFHKIHHRAKPLLGGLSIFICFAAVVFIFLPMEKKIVSLVLSTVVLVFTGIIDDVFNIKPIYKLCGQTVAAFIVVVMNEYLFRFMFDYFAQFYLPKNVVIILIIGWIVLMINAFNLIDGVDGLAAGTATIIFLAMAVLSILEGGRPNILGVQLIGAGACLGFLIFNFNPAKIFMGDTGSMLLGFILATTHLFTIKYPFSAQLVLGSMFILAYPALEVAYTIYRRICSRSSIFKADKGHIHHILLGMGFTVRKVVFIVYSINIIMASLAVLLLSLEIYPRIIFAIGIVTAITIILIFRYLIKLSQQNSVNMNDSRP